MLRDGGCEYQGLPFKTISKVVVSPIVHVEISNMTLLPLSLFVIRPSSFIVLVADK